MESNEINVNNMISVLFQFFSKVDAFGEKIQNGTIKNNVHIKEDGGVFELHLDTDDANAFLLNNGSLVEIIEE